MDNNDTQTGTENILSEETYRNHINQLIENLKGVRDVCRTNNWYASAAYASMAADSLFHMTHMGDKAQRPDFMVSLVDVHYSCYPDEPNQETA